MTFSSPAAFNILNQMLYGVASRVGRNEGKPLCFAFVFLSWAWGRWLLGIPGCFAWEGGVAMGGQLGRSEGPPGFLGDFYTMRRAV